MSGTLHRANGRFALARPFKCHKARILLGVAVELPLPALKRSERSERSKAATAAERSERSERSYHLGSIFDTRKCGKVKIQ